MTGAEYNPDFEALLNYLKQSRGCDLTAYKRASLLRRFGYRMQRVQIDNYFDYQRYLEDHPDEYLALLDAVLINVTGFFRDRDAWDHLATDVIPKILASKNADEPIRVWSAGCSTGQEIYSLLMLLAEALGIETCIQRVQGYATDIDALALQQARKAIYNTVEVDHIPADFLTKYFRPSGSNYEFHPRLSHAVIFGRHDLARDSPISKVDLLLCRNVLIYFKPETQIPLLVRFHFSLQPTGFLFLGKAETILTSRRIFTPVNWKQKIYAKSLGLGIEEILSLTPKSKNGQPARIKDLNPYSWKTAFETSPLAQLAINEKGYLTSANEQAMDLFELTLEDYNRPFIELKPGKLLGHHALLPAFYQNCQAVTLKKLEWKTAAQNTKFLDAKICPIFGTKRQLLGLTLAFQDITETHQLQEELTHTKTELARTSNALQIATDLLYSVSSELEPPTSEFPDDYFNRS